MNLIPFSFDNIKGRKIVTKDHRKAEIIYEIKNAKGAFPLVVAIDNSDGETLILQYDYFGYDVPGHVETNNTLFIVDVTESDLSEFDKEVRFVMRKYYSPGCATPEDVKKVSSRLLDLAKIELFKDISSRTTAAYEQGRQEGLNISGLPCWEKTAERNPYVAEDPDDLVYNGYRISISELFSKLAKK